MVKYKNDPSKKRNHDWMKGFKIGNKKKDKPLAERQKSRAAVDKLERLF